MINNDTAKSTYTVTEGVTEYPIGFQYTTNSDGTPNLRLWDGDGVELEYGTDYKLSDDGLSIVLLAEIAEGTTLNVAVDEPFIQDSDYVVGRIDPEQIEKDFDKSVLRDLQLRDHADDINDRLEDEEQARADADAALQNAIDDEAEARSLADTTLQNNIDAEADAREDADAALQAAINTKQDIIIDLANIRSGAAAGATAVQPSDLSTVATTGSYNDLSNKPKYATSIRLSIDPSTFVVTAQLKDQDNNNIGTAQTIDLPLESVVVSGAYDSATKEVVLTLEGGSTIRFSVADLVSGLQTEITSSNKLDADLVDDSTSANKFVTAAEKTAISTAVQPADLSGYVAKTGDTMTGVLTMINQTGGTSLSSEHIKLIGVLNGAQLQPITISRTYTGVGVDGMITSKTHIPSGAADLGASALKWRTLYATTINNGADIAVPTSGGTMARVEDLPSVMTGADGTNAGTSGLVPAPAATDNDKFLSGDGTWKTAGGGATYTAGNGISIDANNEISVTAPTLTNKATGSYALQITTYAAQSAITNVDAVAIGTNATVTRDCGVAVGRYAECGGMLSIGYQTTTVYGGIAIGANARATAQRAIQIGRGTNNEAGTVCFGLEDSSYALHQYKLMDNDGTIPTARLTKVNTTATLAVADWSSSTQTVTVSGVKADSVVFVSPDPASASDYALAGILCTSQSADSLTFSCTQTPSAAIVVNIVCM